MWISAQLFHWSHCCLRETIELQHVLWFIMRDKLTSTVTSFLDVTERWNQSSQILVHLAQKRPICGNPRRGSSHADSAITNRLFKPTIGRPCQNLPYYFLSPQYDPLRQRLFHMNTSCEDIFIFSHDPKHWSPQSTSVHVHRSETGLYLSAQVYQTQSGSN